jgi:hypothetical protein
VVEAVFVSKGAESIAVVLAILFFTPLGWLGMLIFALCVKVALS